MNHSNYTNVEDLQFKLLEDAKEEARKQGLAEGRAESERIIFLLRQENERLKGQLATLQ